MQTQQHDSIAMEMGSRSELGKFYCSGNSHFAFFLFIKVYQFLCNLSTLSLSLTTEKQEKLSISRLKWSDLKSNGAGGRRLRRPSARQIFAVKFRKNIIKWCKLRRQTPSAASSWAAPVCDLLNDRSGRAMKWSCALVNQNAIRETTTAAAGEKRKSTKKIRGV